MQPINQPMERVKILLVDDAEEQRRRVKAIIERPDLEIVEAADGAEAIRLASTGEFATVLLDVRMPGIDGFDVATALRAREGSPFLPIIFITGAPAPDSFLRRGYSLGAVDFVAHPLIPEVFRTKLDVFIDLYKKTRALDRLAAELEERVRQRTAELEYQSRLTRAITGNATSALFLLDGEGRVLFMNPESERLTGYAAGEGEKTRLADLLRRAKSGAPGRTLEGALADGARRHYLETEFLRKDGVNFFGACSINPFSLEDGSPGAVVEIMDISGRKRAELELKEKEARLQEARRLESVGKLAGGIAHDFNNLLTTINGYCALTLDMPTTGPVRANLREIRTAGERAAALTQQLLAFSRQQVVRLAKPANLNACVAEALPDLSAEAGSGVSLQFELGDGAATLHAEPELIRQILIHLVRNAREAMPSKGTILIRTGRTSAEPDFAATAPEGFVSLSVEDSGMGMDSKVKSRIFEPFFTTKEFGRGAGMGLPMVDGIVSQLGGHITVESALGRGTSFHLHFPVISVVDPAMRPFGDWMAGREKIMIAEPDKVIRAAARRALEERGYSVLSAGDAHGALEAAMASVDPIHLVVINLRIPGMAASELAQRVRESHPDCACLYMSGYTDDSAVRACLQDEGVRFIQIPFTSTLLREMVRDILDTANVSFRE